MPVTGHLKYVELTDFKAGVFTDPGGGKQLIMPATGMQQLDDAYPQVEGGLRAFFQPVVVTTAGIVAPTQEVCTGIAVVSGYTRRTGAGGQGVNGTSICWYMTTWNDTTNIARIYRMDGTGGETAWSAKFTSGVDNSGTGQQSSFQRFVETAGTDYMIVSLRSGGATGTYKVLYDSTQASSGLGSDGVATKTTTHAGVLAVAAARIITGGSTPGTDQSLWWSAIGSASGDGTNFTGAGIGTVIPSPSAPRNGVKLLQTFDPDQLLVGFAGSAWKTITGDISSTSSPIRQMGTGHFPGNLQDGTRTPDGVVFIPPHGPAYLTDGRTFTDISTNLAGFNNAQSGIAIGGPGTGDYGEGFLFLPGGSVSFEEAKGWFKVTDQVGVYHYWDPNQGMLSVSAGVSFTIRSRQINRSLGARNLSYTFRTAPFAQPDGSQSVVREVEIDAQAYSVSSFTVTVTDHFGATTTQTQSGIAVGRQVTSIPIKAIGEYLDVTVTATGASVEAPTIEKVRIGFTPGRRIR